MFIVPVIRMIVRVIGAGTFAFIAQIGGGSTACAVALIKPNSLLRLSEFDRNFLLLGRPNSKIQMSVKEQPFDNVNLYFTYTQVMFWHTIRGEGPFSEVNYNPALFYRWSLNPNAFFNTIDLGFFDHKSNGEGSPSRRSYNDAYVELHADHEIPGGTLLWTTRLLGVYGLDTENRDLRDHFGFWQSSLSYIVRNSGIFNLVEIYSTVHPGGQMGVEFYRGSEEFGLRFKIGDSRSIPYVFIQYFNGFGEGLATYNRSTSTIRTGFQL